MDRRERAKLMQVYECLNTMSGLRPSNPADIAATSRNLRTSTDTARELMYAVFGLVRGEHVEASARIEEAAGILRARVLGTNEES